MYLYLPGGPVWPSLLSRSRRASGIFATRMSSTWGSIKQLGRASIKKLDFIGYCPLSSESPTKTLIGDKKTKKYFFLSLFIIYFLRTCTQTRVTIHKKSFNEK